MTISIKGRDEQWDVTDEATKAVLPEVRVTLHFVDGNKWPVADIELEDGRVVRDVKVQSIEYACEAPKPAPEVKAPAKPRP